eukprot:TRINITY_DN272_c0_g2_i3.p1 TRINITY_DN272_c0_g2~~TRINITY_DN272_c0_g2_i3.p1  ORF type:complete len:270 (+),score=45.72 TRINITY_DN272_c0_g2_i3:124-933(+)
MWAFINAMQHVSVGDAAGVVYWLEAVIIRFYSVEQRDLLKPNPSTSQDTWMNTSFTPYLRDLGYPRVERGAVQLLHALDWILTYAIDLEYQDNADRYNVVQNAAEKKEEEEEEKKEQEGAWPAASNAAQIGHLLLSLASSLGVSDVTAMTASLEEVWIGLYSIVRRRYSSPAIYDATQRSRGNRRSTEQSMDSIHGDLNTLVGEAQDAVFPAGFTTPSRNLNLVASVLRLLYMHDLKQLQFEINRLVAEVQMVTASPQTDVSLGQVGRG